MGQVVTKTLVEVWGTPGEDLSYRVYADKDTPLTDWVDDALDEVVAGVYAGEHAGWNTGWRGFVLYKNADGSLYDAEAFDPMYAADALRPIVLGRAVDVGADGVVKATVGTPGDTPVDHDSGGAMNLSYVFEGVGVDDGVVRAYRTSEYEAGVYVVRNQTATRDDGGWVTPMYLMSGEAYTLIFSKPGVYAPSRKDYAVP